MEPSRDASEGDRGSREFAMPSADRRLRAIAKSAPSLAIFAIFALCGFAAPRFAAATELRVLSYNVRGVPPVISFLGRPGTRIRHIVEKLDAYDVALLQETFSYRSMSRSQAPCTPTRRSATRSASTPLKDASRRASRAPRRHGPGRGARRRPG
jgi:hypothetical protein